MEDYPHSYIAFTRPLILLSGWTQPMTGEVPSQLSKGPRIGSDLPPINSARGQEVQKAFMSYDVGTDVINASNSAVHRAPSLLFRLKSCGRTYVLPSRKASPLASEVGATPTSPGSTIFHSPLSPLSRASPLHPDGIMTPLWPFKYHEAVPAVFVMFFAIDFYGKGDDARDDQLKAQINAVKVRIAESHYATKIAVVLIGEESMGHSIDVEERLSDIRKAVKLDSKSTFFYLPPEASTKDLPFFVESVLSGLKAPCLEFYKAHYKHSRRKKDRKGSSEPSSPPVEGLSQDLPRLGWNIRYEYKMAIFSEFRSELDTSARHHKEVIDLLISPAGAFESCSSWSPRWNELRLLADSSALRRIRCLIASGLPTSAARYWVEYCGWIRDLLERKGKGSGTYGFQAWQSRFSRCMAEIIQSSIIMTTDSNARKTIEVLGRSQRYPYAPAERIPQPSSRLPWECLHHPGYWLSLSARHAQNRGILANRIPPEDRDPPGQSPATRVAHRHETYDTYLCPDPHVEATSYDHEQEVLQLLDMAVEEFAERNQVWMSDYLRLRIAGKLANRSDPDQNALQSLWKENRWRTPGWGKLIQRIAGDLYQSSTRINDFETQILGTWELLNRGLGENDETAYDLDGLLQKASDNSADQDTKAVIQIEDDKLSSFLHLDFVFEKESENFGETLRAQLLVRSSAHEESKPVKIAKIIVSLEGPVSDIKISHAYNESTAKEKSRIEEVGLVDADDKLHLLGETDLTVYPLQTLVLALVIPFREPGKVSAIKATAVMEKPSLRLEYSKKLGVGGRDVRWHVMRGNKLSRQRRFRWTSCQEVNILPKLPKLRIRLPDLADEYYVGEQAFIAIELVNEEAWKVDGTLQVRVTGNHEDLPQPRLLDEKDRENSREKKPDDSPEQICRIGTLPPSGTRVWTVAFDMPLIPSDDFTLEIEVLYNGTKETESEVSKTISAKLNVVEPINATFSVTPNIHPDPWPSFFMVSDAPPSSNQPGKNSMREMTSRWNLEVNLTGLTEKSLIIEDVRLELQGLSDGQTSKITPFGNQRGSISHEQGHEVNFTVDVTKHILEDTSSPLFDPVLTIQWRRADSSDNKCFTKMLAAPRLSLSTNEPRVIATRVPSEDVNVIIDLHLENPSMHYLSFEYGIESNESFAFSGPKLATAHLVPMSKHSIRFVLVPLVRGVFIQPMFRVVDVYFNKSLRVHAGAGLFRETGGNLLLWIDAEP